MTEQIPFLEGREIMDHKDSVISLLLANWDDFYEFLDVNHSDWLYELKHDGLDGLLKNNKVNQVVLQVIIENFLEDNDLWMDLHDQVKEDKEEVKILEANS